MRLKKSEIREMLCGWLRQEGGARADESAQLAFAVLVQRVLSQEHGGGGNPLLSLCAPGAPAADMAASAFRIKRYLISEITGRFPDEPLAAQRIADTVDDLLLDALKYPTDQDVPSFISNREYFQYVVDNALESIFLVDEQGVILSTNPAVTPMLGYEPSDTLGAPIEMFLDEKNAEEARRTLDAVFKGQDMLMPVELEVIHKSGGRRIIEYNVKLLEIPGGRRVAQCVARDITVQHSLGLELQRERDKLNLILHSIGAGLAMVDLEYNVTWINETAREWFPAHAGGDTVPCHMLFFGRQTPCRDCVFTKALQNRAPAQTEKFVAGASDRHAGCYYLFSAAPLFDDKGRITHILEMVQDVTQPHITHEKAHFWHEFFTKVVHNAPVGIVTLEPTGNVLTWNRYMEQTYAIPSSEVVGRNLFDVFPSMQDEGFDDWIRRVMEEREPIMEFDWRHETINMGTRLIEVMLYPLLDEAGELVGVAYINNDVTDRRHMQEELHQARDFLGSMFDAVTDYVFVVGMDGTILDVNRATEEIFHYSARELKGRPWSTLYRNPRECDVLINSLKRKSRVDYMELELVEKDGGVRHVIQSAATIANFRGEPDALAVIGKDITDFKDMQERMLRVQRLNALGELAMGVAHDFNNLLAVILGRSQLMLKQSQDPAIAKGLEVVQRAARHGAETVKRIQSFARRRSGLDQFEEVDLGHMLSEAMEFTRTRWKNDMKRAGHSIELEIKTAQKCMLMGNPPELIEVFTNMIFNAVDAMPEGGRLTLSSTCEGGNVVASISDTGTGMIPDVSRRVFDPFFTTKGMQGTGLGLSVSYGIVERHGGTIEVDSEPGRGTTFRVVLLTRDAYIKRSARSRANHPGPRILVVDDDTDVLDLIVEILRSSDYEVTAAPSGREAADLLERRTFDIVYTDMRMPDVDGWGVVRAARAHNPDVFVVLVTAWAGQVSDEEIKNHGVNALIAKPFQESDILELIAGAEMQTGD